MNKGIWTGVCGRIFTLDIQLHRCSLAYFVCVKGRFLDFRMYHYFTNLFSKLSKSTFNKEISYSKKERFKYWVSLFGKDSLTLQRTPVSAILGFAPKIDTASVVMLQCILG